MDNNKIGVINEVGDLGLGFYPINESEEKQINNNKKKDDKEE